MSGLTEKAAVNPVAWNAYDCFKLLPHPAELRQLVSAQLDVFGLYGAIC